METDFYDEDLPEIHPTLVESLRENKDMLILAAKFVGIPAGLCAITLYANRMMDKYWGPL
jgi:hypothetical protein